MKFLKKMCVVALAVLCLVSVSVTAFASRTGAEEEMSEGSRLWNEFLQAVDALADDSGAMDVTEAVAPVYSNYYAEATGRRAEEYLGMTVREQMIWRVTYIAPYLASVAADYNGTRSSLDVWLENGVGSCAAMFADIYGGSEELRQAYEALMTWDYYYLVYHGAVWCFMENKNSLDILYPEEKYEDPTPTVPVQDEPTVPAEPSEEPTESVPPVDEKPTQGGEKTEIEPQPIEKGLWSETKDAIMEHLLTIVFLIVLVVGLVALIMYRKKKAVED